MRTSPPLLTAIAGSIANATSVCSCDPSFWREAFNQGDFEGDGKKGTLDLIAPGVPQRAQDGFKMAPDGLKMRDGIKMATKWPTMAPK